MLRTLLITARLYDGRYHGVGEGDGPPSPGRLFQALVAGMGLSGPLASQEAEALEWLEGLDPPVIASPLMMDGQEFKNYVPNNDFDAVSGDPRRIGEIRDAKMIKPRVFNAAIPFMYAWTFSDDDQCDLQARVISSLTERLYQFGRGVDLAWAWGEVLDSDEIEDRLSSYPGHVYRPSKGVSRQMLACPQSGSLRSLKTRYAAANLRFRARRQGKTAKQLFSKPPRPLFLQVAYDGPPLRRVYELRLGTSETSFGVWPLARAFDLVVRLRDGAVERLRQALPTQLSDIERVLVGRKADGADDGPTSARLRIVPLPSIGHPHADRVIRRVLVEVPPGCPLRADDIQWAFSGLELVAPEIGVTESLIVTPTADESMCVHYGIGDRTSRIWRTVTPAALPEPARRRRIDPVRPATEAKNGIERAAEQARAAGSVLQALRFTGTRARAEVILVQREPFEAGGERVEGFAPGTRFPKERLWHVEITFTEPINGPLVIGDGRFLGLGVMAPQRDERRVILGGSPASQESSGMMVERDAPRFSVARFAIDGPVLPLVTETLPLAEQARRSLLSKCKYLALRSNSRLLDDDIGPLCPAFWGRDEQGHPRTGHEHAFFLPTDEDGDGRIDHLTVFAKMGFNSVERQAIDRLRRLSFGQSDPLSLLLTGLGRPEEFRTPLLEQSTVWVSATPFLVTRHMKRNGLKRDPREFFEAPDGRDQFVAQVLREEIRRRGLAQEGMTIERLPHVGTGAGLRPLQFRLYRRKAGDDGGARLRGLFRLTFPRPVAGPIALGHSCHYGLGLFVAMGDSKSSER
jgi:CRISPR-associated protein Csb2